MTKKFNWVYGWVWKSVVLIDQWSCINNQLWCYTIVKNTHTHTHTHTMCRGIERYGGLNSHVRDNLDSQFVYRRKSIVLFFLYIQSCYVDVPGVDCLFCSYFGPARCRTQHPSKVLGLAAQPYCVWPVWLCSDMIKQLMFYPKCRSIKVINNLARPGQIHREVNYINYIYI